MSARNLSWFRDQKTEHAAVFGDLPLGRLGEVTDGSLELPGPANQNETFREVLGRVFGKKP